MIRTDSNRVFLAPAEYVDSDHAVVTKIARHLALENESADLAMLAVRIFRHVREIRYDAPDFDRLDSFKASTLLLERRGYCVPKASAFAALCRASGIPSRLGFADVTNHLANPKTLELMGGPTFAWHGYAEVLLKGRWLKVSPTFDSSTCERMRANVLEFDGASDAHLQPFDRSGRNFMTYENFHGVFHDVPARFLASEMKRLYPRAYQAIRSAQLSSKKA